MEDVNAISQPEVKTKRKFNIKKFFLYSLLSIAVLAIVFKIYWNMSGSGNWELEVDKNGVKVYTMKSPGTDLKITKGIVRVKASLASVVMFLQDHTTCQENGCLEASVLETGSDQLYYSMFTYPMPFGLKTREFVVSSSFYQNPKNKEVYYHHIAAPNKIPLNDCCFRMTRFYVLWRFIPLGNGEVEIEMVRDMDLGGNMPNVLQNLSYANSMYRFLITFQSFAGREKYENAKFDFIEELE